MADSIYLKDGSVEYIFNQGDEAYVLEQLIRNRLGDDAADRFRSYTEPYTRSEDEEAMIIDDLTDALRDISEEVEALQKYIKDSQKISRKQVTYHVSKMRRIVDNNL